MNAGFIKTHGNPFITYVFHICFTNVDLFLYNFGGSIYVYLFAFICLFGEGCVEVREQLMGISPSATCILTSGCLTWGKESYILNHLTNPLLLIIFL